jgi:uncharacterized protein DUF3854
LHSTRLPLVIVEGEKKALAVYRLSRFQTKEPRFLPIGIAGVWGFRGITGKEESAKGQRVDVYGPIPDLDLLTWRNRRVYICFDSDVKTNTKVAAARSALANEVRQRGAEVLFIEIPQEANCARH